MQQYLWILPSVSYGVAHEWWDNVIQWIFLKPEQQTIPKPCKMGTSEKQRQSLVGLLASGSAAWITKENKTIVRESYDRCKAKFSTVMEEERGFMVNNGRTTLNKGMGLVVTVLIAQFLDSNRGLCQRLVVVLTEDYPGKYYARCESMYLLLQRDWKVNSYYKCKDMSHYPTSLGHIHYEKVIVLMHFCSKLSKIKFMNNTTNAVKYNNVQKSNKLYEHFKTSTMTLRCNFIHN